jgi:hypothetical protein
MTAIKPGERTKRPANRIFLLIFGIVFMGSGLWLLVIGGQVFLLQCRHSEASRVSCVKRVDWMGVIPMSEKPIEDLQGAWVSVSEPAEGGSTMYRVELITEQGDVPLAGDDVFIFKTYISDDWLREEQEAARINAFVKQGKGTLEIRREGKMYSVLGGLIAFALGLGVATAKIQGR